MTQAEALSRLRNLVNEATAGYYTDPQLYQFLDSAVLNAITLALLHMRERRKTDKYYTSRLLQPLHRGTVSLATTAGTREYSPAELVTTNYIEIDSVFLDADNVGIKYPCVRTEQIEGRLAEIAVLRAYESTSPAYYIRQDKIGFFPTPSSSSGSYEFFYWVTHTAVSSGTSGSQMPLHIESHQALLQYALSEALVMDDRIQEAELQRKLANEILANLE